MLTLMSREDSYRGDVGSQITQSSYNVVAGDV